MGFRPPAPQAGASTNFATAAFVDGETRTRNTQGLSLFLYRLGYVDVSEAGLEPARLLNSF